MQKFLSFLSPTQQTVLVIIGLPLILLAVGLWQLHRTPTPADTAKEVAQLQMEIAQLEELARGKGRFATIKATDGKSYAISLLIDGRKKKIDSLQGAAVWMQTVPSWLARIAVATGAAAALLGGLVLLHIHRMGAQALKSRAKLLRQFQSGQRLLPWFLASLAVLLFTAAVCALAFEVVHYAESGDLSRGDMKLIGAGGVFAVLILVVGVRVVWNLLKASRAVFQQAPLTIMGRTVNEQEAPKLWGFVRDVASRVRAEMPDTIVVGLNQCFFVTEGPVQLTGGAEIPRGRTLYLPLPYMAFMSKPETAAVIGHELAHFTGDDTEYSQRFSPIYSTAVTNLVAVHEASGDDFGHWLARPVTMLGEYFLRSFNEAVQHWSRLRELAADQMGARVASPEAATLALIRVSVLAPRINEALHITWQDGGHGEGVLAETRRLVAEKGLDDPAEYLEDAAAHPTDSHPTTRQRIEALGVQITPSLLDHCRDPRGNDLLIELGLEAGDAGTAALTAAAAGGAVPVSNALEAEFSSAAQTEREEYVTYLRQLAAETPAQPLAIQEGARYEAALLILVGLGMIIGPFFAPQRPLLLVAGLSSGGALLIAGGLFLLKRRMRPIMTLTANGILFANLVSEVPWAQIEDYEVRVVENYGISHTWLTLTLAAGYEPPAFRGDRRVKLKQKKGQIVFSLLGLTGLSVDAFAEQITTYRRSALARAELEQLKVGAN